MYATKSQHQPRRELTVQFKASFSLKSEISLSSTNSNNNLQSVPKATTVLSAKKCSPLVNTSLNSNGYHSERYRDLKKHRIESPSVFKGVNKQNIMCFYSVQITLCVFSEKKRACIYQRSSRLLKSHNSYMPSMQKYFQCTPLLF